MESVKRKFHERVVGLWESYWRKRDDIEHLRRNSNFNQDVQKVRADFAKNLLDEFIQLERDSQNMELDSASVLLLHKVGCCLYGDINDDVSALKHMRGILSRSPDDSTLAAEQSFAIKLSLKAYQKNQTELAKTLSLIKVTTNSAKGMGELRRVIVHAVESVCSNDIGAPIQHVLFAELCRVCILKSDKYEQPTLADFVKSVGGKVSS